MSLLDRLQYRPCIRLYVLFYFSTETYMVGTQKDGLNEAIWTTFKQIL